MPFMLLLLTLLLVMLLLFEITLIPASLCDLLPEFATVNPSSVIPSTVNLIASPSPAASTTGCPIPFSVTDLSTTTFS